MILSLDLGSTRFKAALYDSRLKEISTGAAEIPHIYGHGGLVEMDPVAARNSIRQAIGHCLKHAGKRVKIGGIAITSQAQTFAIADSSGKLRARFVSWQDGRATKACKALGKNRAMKDFAAHSSFGSLLAALQICQLRRLADEGSGPAKSEIVLHLPSWVAFLLTGRKAIDDNLAAMSGLYSLRDGAWLTPAVAAAGLAVENLTEVVPTGSILGKTTTAAREFGVSAGVPVIFAGNDQTAGAYGAEVHKDGSALMTLGTAQVVYATVSKMPKPAEGVIRGPYPGNRFYRMAADSVGGSIVNWARTMISDCKEPKAFFDAATRAKMGCSGLVFDIKDDGSFEWKGVALRHGSADLARSILEALSLRMDRMVGRLGLAAGRKRFKVAGGGSAFPIWRDILGERLGAKLQPISASPLLGAARMARDAGIS